MVKLIFILLSFVGSPMIQAPDYLYSVHQDGTADVWECSSWQVFGDGRWARFNSRKLTLTHQEFLAYFVAREGLCNLYTLGALAEQWRPPVHTFAPDEPAPTIPVTATIWYVKSKSSLTYHLPSCRYANALMGRIEADAAEGFVPCKVCKPNELWSVIAEFMNVESTTN